jgi:hypothetical protein
MGIAERRASTRGGASMESLKVRVGNEDVTGSQSKSVPMAWLEMVTIVRGVGGKVSASMPGGAGCVYLVVERNACANGARMAR